MLSVEQSLTERLPWLAQHPLIRKLYSSRRVTYPSALYSCGVVESADAAVALRADLLKAMRGS